MWVGGRGKNVPEHMPSSGIKGPRWAVAKSSRRQIKALRCMEERRFWTDLTCWGMVGGWVEEEKAV